MHSAELLREYMNRAGLCNSWRIFNENIQRYTWHRPKKGSASRIDLILIWEEMLGLITKCDILPAVRTDHSLCVIELYEHEAVRGPGSWKFNNQLLSEEKFQKGIIETIKECKSNMPLRDAEDLWTALKGDCIKYSTAYSKLRSKEYKEEIENLNETKENLLSELFRDEDLVNEEKDNIVRSIEAIDKSLLLHDIRKTNASIFRSKAEWAQHGELSTKMFFNLEKRNYEKKNMRCIITESGKTSYDQDIILEEQTKFYKGLYRADPKVRFRLEKPINHNWMY